MRIIYFIIVILLFSCSDSEQNSSCVPLLFDKDLYHELDHFGIDLIEYDLNDNCLKVRLGFSGCSSDHTFDLMSQGIETPMEPYSMTCDFYDHNPELCEAYFIVDREFDISPIRERYDQG